MKKNKKINVENFKFEITEVPPTNVDKKFTISGLEKDIEALEKNDPTSPMIVVNTWRIIALTSLKEREQYVKAIADKQIIDLSSDENVENFAKALSFSVIAQCFAMCSDDLESYFYDDDEDGLEEEP